MYGQQANLLIAKSSCIFDICLYGFENGVVYYC